MKKHLFAGLTGIAALLLGASITTGSIMEYYRSSLDNFLGTKSSKIVTDESSNTEDAWNFKSKFKSAKEAYEGYQDLAIREAQESCVLLKNENNALPLAKDTSISLFGIRSEAPVYGNSGGSVADKTTSLKNKPAVCFEDRGFKVNPSLRKTYQDYCASSLTEATVMFGAAAPEYKELASTTSALELTPAEMKATNSAYNSEYSSYKDAAIVFFSRPGGESDVYTPGSSGMDEGTTTTTGNILSLTSEEKAVLQEAEANFDKVVVLLNTSTIMEIKELRDDPKVSSILWVGYPGAFGFYGVADVLNGTVSPSGRLGDTYVTNGAVAPGMQSYGDNEWSNKADLDASISTSNTYMVEAESIYDGYRYYETRYADIVEKNGSASTASAGTYCNKDGTIATTAGTWSYTNEVVYPFGKGLSYATFQENLDDVTIAGDKKTAKVTVTVTNVSDSDVAGKDVIQLYAQSPYTAYDKKYGVEKSAVQLLDYEKTNTLKKGESQTITLNVDLANLASYDYTNAKTYIVDNGTYYFAIGNDAHDALNNILAKKGKTTLDGMDAEGDASLASSFTWNDGQDYDNQVDAKTFSVSDNGTAITNQLSSGDSSMDINSFLPGTVTYLTRQDWDGTFPKKYDNLTPSDEMNKLLKCDYYTLHTDDDTSSYVWGDTASTLTLNDMKGASYDDDRWDELVDKVTIEEFLDFAANAFHNIQKIPSVGYLGNEADDGPNGSDSHTLEEGTYEGKAFEDGKDYEGISTRLCPDPINIGYMFNKELAFENGEIVLGESSLMFNLPIMIGPGMNLHRHGYNGRGGEYYSEDPILSGYTGSAVVQGAQSLGCLVNIKHAAFNDTELNRSGVAVFMNEQKARELELRNLEQAFEAKGKPASFEGKSEYDNTYQVGALGVMSSYNRIGCTPSSGNEGVMQKILRDEWGFKGYNVTDFTGVNPKAAPKESILYGTVAFCGFGVDSSITYWNAASLSKDANMCAAIKKDIKYTLYALANSNALNGVNSSSHTVQLMTSWRIGYITAISVTGVLTLAGLILSVLFLKEKPKEVK